MDALTTTKPLVFVIDIKTIPALHLTNQPRQKFKLALRVGHSVPKRSADLQPDARPTNRRINRHQTAAKILTDFCQWGTPWKQNVARDDMDFRHHADDVVVEFLAFPMYATVVTRTPPY